MKTIKVLSLICFLTISIYGQECFANIEGTVTDSQGNPVINAEVKFVGKSVYLGNRTLRTTDKGFFRVICVYPGDYYISASVLEGGKNEISAPIKIQVRKSGIIEHNIQTAAPKQVRRAKKGKSQRFTIKNKRRKGTRRKSATAHATVK